MHTTHLIFYLKKISIESSGRKEGVDIDDIVPPGFQRKILINIEVVDNLNCSSLRFKDAKNVNLHKIETINLVPGNELISIGISDFFYNTFHLGVGRFFVGVYTAIDMTSISNNENAIKKYNEGLIKYTSEVFHVYIIVFKEKQGLKYKKGFNVYGSYGQYGFLLADIDKMDAFLIKKNISNNLINEFTTTELATELFESGLMVLCWGMVPWQYFIVSDNDVTNKISIYKGRKTLYSGTYKISPKISEVSVIDGNDLINWDKCRKSPRPKLNILGEGGFLSVELYVIDAIIKEGFNPFHISLTDGGSSSIPIPLFSVRRTDNNDSIIEPLLESNIWQ